MCNRKYSRQSIRWSHGIACLQSTTFKILSTSGLLFWKPFAGEISPASLADRHRETYRLHFNQGIPHATTEDDVFKGIFIPKGSTVIANAFATEHDPKVFPEP
jgi:hypothetical protein